MHPSLLVSKVKEFRADIGIAHDGDADRLLLADEKGHLIDGDDILAIAGLEMLAAGRLAHKTVVATIMSNAGLDAAIKNAGGQVIRTAVGDKHVIDEMLRGGYNLGGEQSGHLIFGDAGTTGDGIVAALQILQIMRSKRQPLSELASVWKRFPQLVTNIKVAEKKPFEQIDGLQELLKSAEADVSPGGGRVLLRYSGTEPKARLLMEGPNPDVLKQWSTKIAGLVKKHSGA